MVETQSSIIPGDPGESERFAVRHGDHQREVLNGTGSPSTGIFQWEQGYDRNIRHITGIYMGIYKYITIIQWDII